MKTGRFTGFESFSVQRSQITYALGNIVKRSDSYKGLVNQIGQPNGELMEDENVFRLADQNGEKRYAVCKISKPDTIAKITVVSETKQLDTLWKSPKENSEDS